MIKVLVVTPYAKDGNSFWRCMGPWRYLEKSSRKNLEDESIWVDDVSAVTDASGVAWDTLAGYDLIFMHRPCREGDVTIMRVAKNLGIPVWVDYDDWLFDLPAWNPARGFYGSPATQAIMSTMLACADVITTSTVPLQNNLRVANLAVELLPNAYREDLYSAWQKPELAREQKFAWRGTNTHDGDMLSVMKGFAALPAPTTFIGQPSWLVTGNMPPGYVQHIAARDHLEYFKLTPTLGIKAFLVPLTDCLFNRCKSNIAWMEAIHAGALCVAPDMPEWRDLPGCLLYTPGNAQSFLNAAEQAFNHSEEEVKEQVSLAMDTILKYHSIEHDARLRRAIIDRLIWSGKRNPLDPADQMNGLAALARLQGKAQSLEDQLSKES